MDWSTVMAERAISYPFKFSAAGTVATTSDRTRILKDRIILMCLTQIGERLMLPTYGTTVPATLFENEYDAVTLAKQSIVEGFAKWFPELVFKDLQGDLDNNTSDLTLEIHYNDPEGNPQTVGLRTALFTRYGDIIEEVTGG
jgi:phage baseplate assembly protein W